MKTRAWFLAPVVASLLVAAAARADEDPQAPKDPEQQLPKEEVAPTYVRYPSMGSHVVVGFELGVGIFEEGNPFAFSEGTGSGTSPGPSWGVRIGWEFTPWLAIDAHYLGIGNVINRDYALNGNSRLITNAAMAELRLTAPFRYVQPYIFGGVGIYGTVASANTAFNNSTQPGFPMGVGVAFPITDHLSVGAEATYHFQLGEAFSSNDAIAGGDLTTFNAMLRMRL